MAYGISAANVSHPVLNWLRGATVMPAQTPVWIKIHIGDPGAAGTGNPSVVTTRFQATMNAAASGQITLSGTVGPWTGTGTETLQGVSAWSDPTAGVFKWSAPLASNKPWVAGDTFTLTALTVVHTVIAA